MKLVHLITGLELGGAEQMLFNLISTYPDLTTEHIVLYARVGPIKKKLEDIGVRCVPVILSPKNLWNSYNSVYAALEQIKPDCVHGLLWLAIFVGRVACWRLGIPFVGVFHSNPVHNGFVRNALDVLTVRFFPARYYAVSHSVRATVLQKIYNNPAIGVVPNGIDTHNFAFNERNRAHIRNLLAVDEDAIVIGAVGRLVGVKRYDWLIEVVARLKKRLPETKVLLVIVGAGPEHKNLQNLAEKLDLKATVKLVGARTPINLWYSAFDVLAISSASEGMSMVLLEGLSAGLPLVTTSSTPEHDVVKQGENGFVCQAEDQDRFLLALERLVFDKELRKIISEKNRHLARNSYEIQGVAGRYHEIFKENLRG